jgi:hypothetical protein
MNGRRASRLLVPVLGLVACGAEVADEAVAPPDRPLEDAAAREEAPAPADAASGGQDGATDRTSEAAPPADRGPTPGDPLPGRDAGPPPAAPDDGTAQARIAAAVARVYDLDVLHRIEVTVAPNHVPSLERKNDPRVPCTFAFDGVKLENVGVRQAGGAFNPAKKIGDKPSLSVKFDEFVPKQKLHGLGKIILKNAYQDMSVMNEHFTYEVFRRAGLAAPTTAYAVVTINGVPSGIYVMREPVNKDFLVRNFGKGFEQGNLYEVDYFKGRDFVNNPTQIDLKDELEEGRSRQDILALAAAVRSSTAPNFVATVGPLFDIDRYATYMAAEAVTSDFDGFSFHNNNSYLYHHPKDGRFVTIPWGADQAFWCPIPGQEINRLTSPTQTGDAQTSRKFRAVPALEAKLRAEIARLGSPPVWDTNALLGRVQHLAKLFSTTPRTGRTARDLDSFDRYRPILEAFIRAGGTSKGTASLPRGP